MSRAASRLPQSSNEPAESPRAGMETGSGPFAASNTGFPPSGGARSPFEIAQTAAPAPSEPPGDESLLELMRCREVGALPHRSSRFLSLLGVGGEGAESLEEILDAIGFTEEIVSAASRKAEADRIRLEQRQAREAREEQAVRERSARAEREAAERAEREAAERAERERFEREAQERAEREQAERKARDLAELERAEREREEREAQDLAERERAERAALAQEEQERTELESAPAVSAEPEWQAAGWESQPSGPEEAPATGVAEADTTLAEEGGEEIAEEGAEVEFGLESPVAAAGFEDLKDRADPSAEGFGAPALEAEPPPAPLARPEDGGDTEDAGSPFGIKSPPPLAAGGKLPFGFKTLREAQREADANRDFPVGRTVEGEPSVPPYAFKPGGPLHSTPVPPLQREAAPEELDSESESEFEGEAETETEAEIRMILEEASPFAPLARLGEHLPSPSPTVSEPESAAKPPPLPAGAGVEPSPFDVLASRSGGDAAPPWDVDDSDAPQSASAIEGESELEAGPESESAGPEMVPVDWGAAAEDPAPVEDAGGPRPARERPIPAFGEGATASQPSASPEPGFPPGIPASAARVPVSPWEEERPEVSPDAGFDLQIDSAVLGSFKDLAGPLPKPFRREEKEQAPQDAGIPSSVAYAAEGNRLVAPCPRCAHLLNVNSAMLGVSGNCPNCKSPIIASESRTGGVTQIIVTIDTGLMPYVEAPPANPAAMAERSRKLKSLWAAGPAGEEESTAFPQPSVAPEPQSSPDRTPEPGPPSGSLFETRNQPGDESGSGPSSGSAGGAGGGVRYTPPTPRSQRLFAYGNSMLEEQPKKSWVRWRVAFLVALIGACCAIVYYAMIPPAGLDGPGRGATPAKDPLPVSGEAAALAAASAARQENFVAKNANSVSPAASLKSPLVSRPIENTASLALTPTRRAETEDGSQGPADEAGTATAAPDGEAQPQSQPGLAITESKEEIVIAESGDWPSLDGGNVRATGTPARPEVGESVSVLFNEGAMSLDRGADGEGTEAAPENEPAGTSEAAATAVDDGEPTEEELAALPDRERIEVLSKRVLTGFMKARTWQEKQKFVLHPEKDAASMEDYYRAHEKEPFEGLVTSEGVLLDESTKLWVSAFNIWVAGNSDYLLAYVVGNEKVGLKVDWDWYYQLRGEGMSEYFAEPRPDPVLVRAVMRRSHFYGEGTDSRTEPFAVILETPFTQKFTGTVYLDPLSPVAQEIKRSLGWNETRMATLEIEWLKDNSLGLGDRVGIKRFLGWGLALDLAF